MAYSTGTLMQMLDLIKRLKQTVKEVAVCDVVTFRNKNFTIT